MGRGGGVEDKGFLIFLKVLAFLFICVVIIGFILLIGGCRSFEMNGPLQGNYDADGNLIVEPEIEMTYKLPDISAGVALSRWRVTMILAVELFDKKLPVIRVTTGELFVGENLFGVGLTHRFTSIMEFKVGLWAGWSVKSGSWVDKNKEGWTGGVVILISKF